MKRKIAVNNSQQGDVKFRRLDKMPEGEQRVVARGRLVLAHGESGHSHVIEDNEAELIQIGERMIMTINKSTVSEPLTHEEHGGFQFSPGIWEVGRVQEYDWFSKLKRPVQD